MKGKIYFPAFVGKDGGAIEKAYDLAQLHDALDFWIGFHSEKTVNYSISVAGSGKLVVEQKNGTIIQTSEYWLTKAINTITINYSNGKDVKLYGCITYLDCSNIDITSLDLSHNPALKYLSCVGNQLTSLDLSHNPALEILYCNGNQITSLDLSHNPALEELYCDNNQIASLDVSHNPALKSLDCNSNQLTSLDVSHNPALIHLFCGNNSLTSLDVSHNPATGCNGDYFTIYGNPLWLNGNLDRIIAQLPDWSEGETAYFYYYCDEEGEDEEAIYCLTESQTEALEAKNWEASNDY